MVSKDEVEKFMLSYFPSCPLCGAEEGYEVSGLLKNYVQCKSCGAKWVSSDFGKCKELRNLTLLKPAYDNKGVALHDHRRSVDFWKDAKKVEKALKEVVKEEPKQEPPKQPTQTPAKVLSEMKDERLLSFIDANISAAEVCSSSAESQELMRVILSNPADRAMMWSLQALIYQNKAIIGQNERLYRLLSKKRGQKLKKH